MKEAKEQLEHIKEWMKSFGKEDLSASAYEQICHAIDHAISSLEGRRVMKFFKPEDCSKYLAEIYGDGTDPINKKATQLAKLLNKQLEREGKVVYAHHGKSTEPPGYPVWISKGYQDADSTHKALLINIEPIEQCKHPAEKVKASHGFYQDKSLAGSFYQCECGARVRPLTFEKVEGE